MSLPGLVDFDTGTALFTPHFKWRDWAVRRGVGEATVLPVIVGNDANAVALAELWFGRPEVQEVREFMVLVESGLGTGVVLDGPVYRGEAGAAGEFGHMTIGQEAAVACATGSPAGRPSPQSAALACYAAADGRVAQRINFSQLMDRSLGGEREARAERADAAGHLGVADLIKALARRP